jgi:hypothetical protein
LLGSKFGVPGTLAAFGVVGFEFEPFMPGLVPGAPVFADPVPLPDVPPLTVEPDVPPIEPEVEPEPLIEPPLPELPELPPELPPPDCAAANVAPARRMAAVVAMIFDAIMVAPDFEGSGDQRDGRGMRSELYCA